jgi:hypothetical protein
VLKCTENIRYRSKRILLRQKSKLSQINDSDLRPNDGKQVNVNQLGPIGTNYDTLRKWMERVRTCTESRLNELVPGDWPRVEKEMALARHLMEDEVLIFKQAAEAIERGESTFGYGLMLSGLEYTLTVKSSEEVHAAVKEQLREKQEAPINHPGKYYKHSCEQCGIVFHSASNRSHRCRNDNFIKQRKERLETIRSSKICLFCKSPFKARRTTAKYCQPDHRIRAFLQRRKESQN